MPRLFVGIALPQVVREELARTIRSLRGSTTDAKWVPPENLHVTIAFLGRVEDDKVASVSDAVARAVTGHVDFTVALAGLGAFPSTRRARVTWAGLDDPARGVEGLADSVVAELESVGFERDPRPFHSHITLARMRFPEPLQLDDVSIEPIRFPVQRLTLFESRLGRPAPRYESLATFPFRRSAGSAGSSRT